MKRTTGSLLLSNLTLTSLGQPSDRKNPVRGIGMCDWTLGGAADPGIIAKAAGLQLDCLQVSVGTSPDHIALRDDHVLRAYESMSSEHDVKLCSVAAGSILNRHPLATEPMSAVFVIDALEAASRLHCENVLLAFFGEGDLRLHDESGTHIVETSDPFTTYMLDEMKVQRVVEVLRQIVPRAEAHGVYLGLENTLTAAQNMDIINAVGSEMVKVYYDVGNSWASGYDVPGEIRFLGNEMICEVHIKDKGSPLFTSDKAMVNMPACATALREIGYDKWLVLESRGRKNKLEEDTIANMAYLEEVFAMN